MGRISLLLIGLLLVGCQNERNQAASPSLRSKTPLSNFRPLMPAVPDNVWTHYRKEAEAKPRARPDLAQTIVGAMAAVNHAEIRGEQAPVPTLAGAQWTYVQETSPATYVQLGRHLGLRTIDSLEEVLRLHQDPSRVLREAKAPTEVVEYRALGGLFIEHAQQSGLLGRAPLSNRKRALLQAVFLRKWVTAVPARADVWSHLRAEEHRWYLRYLAEAQHQAPLADTLAALDQLERVDGYPAGFNRAVFQARAGLYQAAATSLEGNESSAAKRLRARLEQAQGQ